MPDPMTFSQSVEKQANGHRVEILRCRWKTKRLKQKTNHIEEGVTANEKVIRNDGSDNGGGYFNRIFYCGEVNHSRGNQQGRPFHRL